MKQLFNKHPLITSFTLTLCVTVFLITSVYWLSTFIPLMFIVASAFTLAIARALSLITHDYLKGLFNV